MFSEPNENENNINDDMEDEELIAHFQNFDMNELGEEDRSKI